MSIWINIDKPLMTVVLHSCTGCRYEQAKAATPLKGIGELKRDGGWISFPMKQVDGAVRPT